ncbi:MAG: beta-propeller domain-containing protein [Planctomycetes bacterium]|nr:beta-propeller domain-containing protein [Planctomycetota bacterium]
MLEVLEDRVVLDAQLGVEVAQTASDISDFERFESATELQQFLVDEAVDQWKDVFGTSFTRWPYTPVYFDDFGALDSPVPQTVLRNADLNAIQVAEQIDGTNVQVTGVDEADLVKTDGEYLYIANDGRLSIIDARNPSELSLAAELPLDSHAAELYVSGDRLVVLSNEPLVFYDVINLADASFPGRYSGPQTSVAIYDIADRTSPELIQETILDGSVTASRRIDDLVYLVTSDSLASPVPNIECEAPTSGTPHASTEGGTIVTHQLFAPAPYWPDAPPVTCVYETQEEYLERVEVDFLDLIMPLFETTDSSGEVVASGMISEPTDIYKPLVDDPSNLTSIVVFDLAVVAPGISASTGVMTGYSSTVYAAAENIYVATISYSGDGNVSTILQQFTIAEGGANVGLAAVGNIAGSLLNQFSIDEHEGFLRVVTSIGWSADRTNQLFVLEQLDTRLDIIGSIDEIATGESVFAVRFVGDEAFVVTFRVVDPLFTIDLSEPANPTIAGELKIPGFSNYLHPISEDLLFGLGRDEGGFRGSPQLSLFDVSDFSLPERVDNFVFDGATWSEAFYNHHAISYFPDSQIAVVPFQGSFGICIDGVDFGECYPAQASAFWVIQVDTTSDDKSIQLLGTIEHEDTPLRSLRIGDNLFTISAGSVKVTELLQPESLIDELYFGQMTFMDYLTVDVRDHEVKLDVLHNDRVGEDATIVEVGESETGASVEIAPDGKTLLYTAADHSEARSDLISYTVQSGNRRETTTVRVNITREADIDRMIRLVKRDLAERLGIVGSSHQIQVASVRRQEWPDSCLGVPSEGVACAQVITPGFKIILEHSLTNFVYHTDRSNRFIAVVDPAIETDDLIRIRAEVLDATGEPTTNLIVGEEATLRIHADDLRADALGVFAAYFDVRYDAKRLLDLSLIDHNAEFSHGVSGTIDDGGLIDEVGGFNSEANPASTLVVSIPFVANSPGELRFTTDAADITPANDSLLLGVNSRIPFDRIEFGEVVVKIMEFLHNADDPTDANMDGEMTPLDALVIMNHLNRHGAGRVNAFSTFALRSAALEAAAPQFAADVNRDGFISPIDVLMIVNALDARSRVFAEGEASAFKYEQVMDSILVPPLAASSNLPYTRPQSSAEHRIDALLTAAVNDVFPLAESIDFASELRTESAAESKEMLNGDNLFAELATNDWWQD